MDLKLDNYSKHVGRRGDYDWYRWKVFVAGSKEDRESIDRVEYRLHETFPKPIRVVEDKDSGFALESSGWGEFKIFVTVYLKDGTERRFEYWLDLGKSWPESG